MAMWLADVRARARTGVPDHPHPGQRSLLAHCQSVCCFTHFTHDLFVDHPPVVQSTPRASRGGLVSLVVVPCIGSGREKHKSRPSWQSLQSLQ